VTCGKRFELDGACGDSPEEVVEAHLSASKRPDPVAYRYTDAQAVADGVLVDTERAERPGFGPHGIGRVSRAVWDHFSDPEPGVIGPDGEEVRDIKDLLALGERIMGTPADQGGWRKGEGRGRAVICLPNEVGSLTLCFPEDL